MENDKKENKKWYQNVWIVGGLIFVAIITVPVVFFTFAPTDSSLVPTQVQGVTNTAPVSQPSSYTPQQTTTNTQQGENNNLSNTNTYTNVSGNQVHSPAYSQNGQAPDGATAQCGDGTYSFSQHRSGTCSHHGGVSNWLQ